MPRTLFLSFCILAVFSLSLFSLVADSDAHIMGHDSELVAVRPHWLLPDNTLPYQPVFAEFHTHNHIDGLDHFAASPSVLHETEAAYKLGLYVDVQTNHAEALTEQFWTNQQRVANTFRLTHENAVPFIGYEWTRYGIGPQDNNKPSAHCNVYNCDRLIGTSLKVPSRVGIVAHDPEEFYDAVISEHSKNSGVFFQFNHPWAGSFHFANGQRPRRFNELRSFAKLLEIDSGIGNHIAAGLGYYNQFLENGWHVAPTCCNDTEDGVNWLDEVRCTCLWVDKTEWKLDHRLAVNNAIDARRMFALHGGGLLLFGAASMHGKVMMGESIMPGFPIGQKVDPCSFAAEVFLYYPGGLKKPKLTFVEVYADRAEEREIRFGPGTSVGKAIGGALIANRNKGEICCYIKVADGENLWVSSPIWLINNPATGGHD